ncbi:MAG: PD-(D/E)XK nuclease family protein [Lachnospiraceae bacterium]|nr:PD-(D/E)XK nuclease family protein [Lachnospiraceae bacterium]
MSLYYHVGSSGAGKTTGVQKRIIEEAEREPERNFLFVVPEQFTLQTQREILSRSKTGGMMNIDALSFARLAHRVFEEQGVSLPQVLEDTGKTMIVKRVLQEQAEKLTIYKGKIKKQGFVEEMKSLIAEFYQYGIDPGKLDDMQEMAGDRRILNAKLHDIKVVYEAFRKFIEDRFVMNEEVLDKMCEIAVESDLIKNSVVVFDGFTGFTPSQYNCIDKLMKYAADIHVVLTIDKETVYGLSGIDGKSMRGYQDETEQLESSCIGDKENRYSAKKFVKNPERGKTLFELSIKTIEKLEKLALSNNIQSGFVIYRDEKGRYRENPSLRHLEHNIFRFPYTKCEDHSSIKLLSASDPDEEADFVVAKIRELILGSGEDIRYENIAVLTGDLASYGPVLSGKLLKAGIPHFVDEKRSIVGLSAVEFIDAAMDIVLSDFSYESVFRFAKTGLTGIDDDSISKTENFVIEKGIKGFRRWKQEWKTGETDPQIELSGDVINLTRKRFIDLLEKYRVLEKAPELPTVKERLTALYGILDTCEAELKLFELSEKLKQSENPKERTKGVEYSQLFRAIVTVFERINSLLGEERMPLKEFKEVLDTGFSESKLRSIPGGVDSIVVGDMERTRIDNKKVIFFVGCNDSVLPGAASKVSLLNEFDRELFAENDIELSPTARENMSLKEFYLYLALTKPSEKLYLSYSKHTADSGEARPAYIFGRIMKLYEGLEVQKLSGYETGNIYRILGSDRGLSAVIEGMRALGEKSVAARVIKKIFEDEEPELMRLLSEAKSPRKKSVNLGENEAEELYGRIILGSITRLQQFAACAFSHFAKYGLKLKERKEYRIGGLELGSIYHKALETYAAGLKKDRIRWCDVGAAEKDKREQEAIETALTDFEDIVSSSKRYEYIKRSLKRVFDKTVTVVSAQIAAGKFDVGFVEKGFSHESTLMKLTGVIDRVDVVKKNGKTYFRIIDYKTGKTSFDIEKMKAGLQLQLAIYTAEAVAELAVKGEEAVPTGMYYYRIDDPVVEMKAGSVEGIKPTAKEGDDPTDAPVSRDPEQNTSQIPKEVLKMLRLDGLTVDENEIVAMHDRSMISDDGKRIPGSSYVINYECKKDGTLSKSSLSNVLEPEEFEDISKTATRKAKELSEDILKGNVSVNPYEYKQENACNYCVYRSVCKFDRRLGDSFRGI